MHNAALQYYALLLVFLLPLALVHTQPLGKCAVQPSKSHTNMLISSYFYYTLVTDRQIVVPASTQLLRREDAQRLARSFPLSYIFYSLPMITTGQTVVQPARGGTRIIQDADVVTQIQRENSIAGTLQPKRVEERSFKPLFADEREDDTHSIPEGFKVYEAVPYTHQ